MKNNKTIIGIFLIACLSAFTGIIVRGGTEGITNSVSVAEDTVSTYPDSINKGLPYVGLQTLYYKFILSDNNTHKGYTIDIIYDVNGVQQSATRIFQSGAVVGTQCDNIIYVPIPVQINTNNANTIKLHISFNGAPQANWITPTNPDQLSIGCAFPSTFEINCGSAPNPKIIRNLNTIQISVSENPLGTYLPVVTWPPSIR